jgi:tetratricopeptide (TPR) repeat protein
MTKVKQTQLLLLVIAVGLFVLLYIAPKKPEHPPRKEGMPVATVKAPMSIESFVKTAAGVLAPDLKQQHDLYLNRAGGTEKSKWLDSLVAFWDKTKRPDIASFYFEKRTALDNKATSWFKAGDRYYYSLRFIKAPDEVPSLYQSAMRCYENGLKLEPNNTDGKIMLAACFVEGSQDPMKGITMLKEIEKTDSNNVKLQLNFAFFSVKSQQWDKAIRRFEKVLQIDSAYIEAYLHLADAYEQQGNKTKTIEMLEKYVTNTNDITSKQEIKKYIQQLKTN